MRVRAAVGVHHSIETPETRGVNLGSQLTSDRNPLRLSRHRDVELKGQLPAQLFHES